MNPKVNWFFEKDTHWKEAYAQLRQIALDCELTEELKWGCPCYTYKGANIVLIHGFKEYCAYLFHKGALLNDAEKILIQQTENVQSARQARFTNVREIVNQVDILRSYIYEAIEVEKAALKVEMKKTDEFPMPEELENKFQEDPGFKAAFESLTPGRQRGYLLHFTQAKQSATRTSRIEKAMPKIFEGKGWNER
ncbi:YdeI/OmpD-associated family protein [Ekhidna sp. MALMAid0563]|uniref:YdeI/OmpD-associated family protein n=1 Tax=Ekhidna sp. MALMAid0563 TaxID=3143937 RepID=UPI0032DE65AD